MINQHIDMTKGLHDALFKFCAESQLYRIERPQLDNLVGMFGEELERMKREEKKDG